LEQLIYFSLLMILNEAEYYELLKLHKGLIYYVGQKKKLIKNTTTFEEFTNSPAAETYPVRNALYENIDLIDDFIKDNSEIFSEEEKEIIRGFRHFCKGRFHVIKLTKKYAHFLGETYVYGVHALSDPFECFWSNRDLPTMIEAVLLPFKGKIVYDGIISGYRVRFGKGMRDSIKNNYALSEGKYGIITELSEVIDESILENSFERELLAMMKTKVSREHNWYEIQDLIEEHPNLRPIYMREWGRVNSRAKKKELKELGITKRWFAMYNDAIVLSEKTEQGATTAVDSLVKDKEKRAGIYYFKV
jgi:hypothetical protein